MLLFVKLQAALSISTRTTVTPNPQNRKVHAFVMFVQGKGIDIVQPTPRNVLAMFLGREDLRQLWPLEVELQRGRHP